MGLLRLVVSFSITAGGASLVQDDPLPRGESSDLALQTVLKWITELTG